LNPQTGHGGHKVFTGLADRPGVQSPDNSTASTFGLSPVRKRLTARGSWPV
jgi:hypothetical protein